MLHTVSCRTLSRPDLIGHCHVHVGLTASPYNSNQGCVDVQTYATEATATTAITVVEGTDFAGS